MSERIGRDSRKEPVYTGTTLTDHLIFLRDTFSDVIPEEIVHSNQKDNRYKVRKNWFTGLFADLELALDDDLIPEDELDDIRKFLDRGYSDEFKINPTTSDDISQANSFINKLVARVDSDPLLWTESPTYKINFV